MDTIYPLTVYYDHSCALCRNEVYRLKQRDHANLLLLEDCSAADFTPPPGAPSKDAMMRLLHAQTAEGSWLIGVPVFQHMYRAAGFGFVADWLAKPVILRIVTFLYPVIALHRYMIPACISNMVIDWLARKSLKRSQSCKDHHCSL